MILACMIVGHVRVNSVRSLSVYCCAGRCSYRADIAVDPYGDDVSVPVFGLRLVSTAYGIIGADVRSNSKERAVSNEIGWCSPN